MFPDSRISIFQLVYNSYIVFVGPRGFQQELWTDCNVRHVDQYFDDRFKPGAYNYISTIRTDKQELSSIYNNYDGRFDTLCAKFNGYFRPPYSGYFKLLINADDTGDFFFSDCERNCSDADLVSKLKNQNASFFARNWKGAPGSDFFSQYS